MLCDPGHCLAYKFYFSFEAGNSPAKEKPLSCKEQEDKLAGLCPKFIFSITEPLSLYFLIIHLKGKMINYIVREVIHADW